MTTEDVVMEYRKRLSIRETARELDISEGTVRKCLITHGEIETAMTRRIGELLKEGRSQKEICGILGISYSCVNANSPYERGMQIEPSQTANARRIRECRARKATNK
nr:MAG TPA: Toxin co-regulated pilus virulence regulatory, XylS, virulence regulation, cholerae [Bacteriophage sp.]